MEVAMKKKYVTVVMEPRDRDLLVAVLSILMG
jgi:hypothetical protein